MSNMESKPDYSRRIRQFQKAMPCRTAILVSEEFNPSVFYFTGFTGFGILIINKMQKPVFIASILDASKIANRNMEIKMLGKDLKILLKKNSSKSIGLDFSSLTMNYYKYIKKIIKPRKISNVSDALSAIRAKKEEYEIRQIKRAAAETDKILSAVAKELPKFRYEYEVKNFIDSLIKSRGFDIAFDTIVASGRNSANPHYSICTDGLKKGFLIIDLGLKVNGYCSDVTRTFYLGNPGKEEIELYDKVLAVQEKCAQMLSTGIISDADGYARQQLGKKFIHALGHGIGIEVHELPDITSRNKSALQDNSCIAVEPGIYFPGKFGIRIEDDFIRTNGALRQITKFPKRLIQIRLKQ